MALEKQRMYNMSKALTELFYKWLEEKCKDWVAKQEAKIKSAERHDNKVTYKKIQFVPNAKEIYNQSHSTLSVVYNGKAPKRRAKVQCMANFAVNPRGAESDFVFVAGLWGEIDCGKYEIADLRKTCLAKVDSVVGGKYTYMKGANNVSCVMNFRNSVVVDLSETNLAHAKIWFNPRGNEINLAKTTGLPEVLVVGNTRSVIFTNAKMHNVKKIVCGPNTKLKNLPADFSGEIKRITGRKMSEMIANNPEYNSYVRNPKRKFCKSKVR